MSDALQAPTKRKQPEPSRLRHEIHPESTDDSSGPDEVQVPDSQVIVPETQGEEISEDVPLSPKSTAVLKRNAVSKTKGKRPVELTTFGLKFPNDQLENGNRATSPSAGFAFAKPAKQSAKGNSTSAEKVSSELAAIDDAVISIVKPADEGQSIPGLTLKYLLIVI